MKKILLPLISLPLLIVSCEDKSASSDNQVDQEPKELLYYFGDSISQYGTEEAAKLPELIKGKDTARVKLAGVINEVCQVKGCWMTMNVGEDEMRVTFKDYGFFMPKNASGKKVIVEGFAVRDTTSIDELRHYAEDAGESEEDIAKITQPEYSLTFEASGVIIKDEE